MTHAKKRGRAGKLTDNDLRVLRAVERACGEYDGFAPHGAADWTAIRRLLTRELITGGSGHATCQDCTEPHEGPYYMRATKELSDD